MAHPCNSKPLILIAFSEALLSSNVATIVNLSKAIFPLPAACLQALIKTPGWKSYDKSNYSEVSF
jgi:hypothetical protein